MKTPLKSMTIQKARQLTKTLKQYLLKFPHNIVIISASGVGAGHERQARFLEEYLSKYVQVRPIFVSLSLENKTASRNHGNFISSSYAFFQKHPPLFRAATKILELPLATPFIDLQIQSLAQPKYVYSSITKTAEFRPDLPTLFLTTYGAAEVTAVMLLKNQIKNGGGIIAFVPDPLPRNLMRVNTSSIRYKKHLVILHNGKTQQEYFRIRNTVVPTFALGTLSHPYFLLEKENPSVFSPPIHIGLETGGNPNVHVDKLFMQFISNHTKELQQNELFITVHLMHHTSSMNNFKQLRNTLAPSIRKNIRLLAAKNLDEAIKTRHQYLTGSGGFPIPIVVFSKGGEVPLEYRRQQIIGCIYGTGHEEIDILTGVEENRAIDLRNIHPRKWLELALTKAKENQKNHHFPTPSYAIFAPLLYFDPHALDTFL